MRILLFLQFGIAGNHRSDIQKCFSAYETEIINAFPKTSLDKDILLITSLPLELAVSMINNLNCSVININPQFEYVMILKNSDNSKEVFSIAGTITQKFNLNMINSSQDIRAVAPVLRKEDGLHYSSDESINIVNEAFAQGKKVNIYTDRNVVYGEEIINSYFINLNKFVGVKIYERLVQHFKLANMNNEPSIFVTYFNLDDELDGIARSNSVLLITPKKLVLGIEYVRRASPEYAVDELLNSIRINHININAIDSIAMLSLATKSDIVPYLCSRINATCVGYDSKRFVTRRERYGLSELLALTEYKDGNLIISNKDLRNGILYSLVAPSEPFPNCFLIKS